MLASGLHTSEQTGRLIGSSRARAPTPRHHGIFQNSSHNCAEHIDSEHFCGMGELPEAGGEDSAREEHRKSDPSTAQKYLYPQIFSVQKSVGAPEVCDQKEEKQTVAETPRDLEAGYDGVGDQRHHQEGADDHGVNNPGAAEQITTSG